MKFDFHKKILKSGMIVLFEKRNVPVVSVAIAVRNGGINEALHEKGISHFVEHMLYKGTPMRSAKKISEEIEKNGGVLNGFTDEAITSYWCKMPSKHLNIALEVLGDMVKNPLFDEKEFEKERKVIFEEIKMRKDNPGIHALDKIQELLYEKPLGAQLIGTYDTINSITRKSMIEKFKNIYQPNNMILCVVGDANFDEIVKFVEKNFGNGNGKVPSYKVSKRNKSVIEKRKGIDQAVLAFAYHVPLVGDKKSHTAEVLSTLMAEGMSSRLFTEIREKRNLAYSISGIPNINKDFAYNCIKVGTTKENIEKVKELILEEFKKVAKNLDEKELNQVKEQMTGNISISMEDSQNQMIMLLGSEIEGKIDEFYEFEKNIRNVKLEDVKKMAGNVEKAYSFFALAPE